MSVLIGVGQLATVGYVPGFCQTQYSSGFYIVPEYSLAHTCHTSSHMQTHISLSWMHTQAVKQTPSEPRHCNTEIPQALLV